MMAIDELDGLMRRRDIAAMKLLQDTFTHSIVETLNEILLYGRRSRSVLKLSRPSAAMAASRSFCTLVALFGTE